MAALRKTLFQLHRWFGVHVSLLLFVLCFTGSVATLGYQIESLVDPGWRAAPAAMNWSAAEKTLQDRLPREWVVYIAAPAEPGLAATASIDGPKQQRRTALLDPGTGALQGVRSSLSVQSFLRQYHKALLLPRGLLFYGVISFVLLGFALSGLIVYRNFWTNLFRLRLGDNPRVRWADIHRTLGVWVALFAVLVSITSAWYLVDGIVRPNYGPSAPKLETSTVPVLGKAHRLSMNELVQAAQAKVPGFEVRALRMQWNPNDPVCAYGQSGALLMDDDASEVCMDPFTGTVTYVHLPEDHGALSAWKHTADGLHYGTLGALGGLWSRVLYCALGLLLSLVVLAGPMLAAVRARASGRRPARDLKAALGVLVMLYTAGLLAGSAAFTVVTLRRPTSTVMPAPDAVSEVVRVGGAEGIVARYGEDDTADYVVLWASQPPPFEKVELVPDEGETLSFDGWKRPSARGPVVPRGRLRVRDFAGTATTSAPLTMVAPSDPAPYDLSEGPTKVAQVVKGAAGAVLGFVALAGLLWLWVLWRPIFFARKED